MSFQQALSGLSVANQNLDVIGNNVANAGTVGFKQGSAQFADLFSAAASNQAGLGAQVTGIAQSFAQGAINATNNPLDVAVSGNGFFRMDNNGTISFSRDGQFQVDANNYLVNSSGFRLTGYPASTTGALNGAAPQDLQISKGDLTPLATSKMSLGVNLDSRTAAITAPFDNTNPATYSSTTSATLYDSLGNQHIFSVYYAKTASNNFAVYGSMDNSPIEHAVVKGTGGTFPTAYQIKLNGSTIGDGTTSCTEATVISQINAVSATTGVTAADNGSGQLVLSATASGTPINLTVTSGTLGLTSGTTQPNTPFQLGTLVFNTDGTLNTTSSTTQPMSVSETLSNGATSPMKFTMDLTGTTQFGSDFGVNSLSQDGYASGHLTNFDIGADGTLTGHYSNNQTRVLGQIVLANFADPQGLQSIGNNQYMETAASGQPLVGAPETSSLGSLQSSALEQSNVDLTTELVNMITAQRDYQANAESIKTEDQIMQTIVNLR